MILIGRLQYCAKYIYSITYHTQTCISTGNGIPRPELRTKVTQTKMFQMRRPYGYSERGSMKVALSSM